MEGPSSQRGELSVPIRCQRDADWFFLLVAKALDLILSHSDNQFWNNDGREERHLDPTEFQCERGSEQQYREQHIFAPLITIDRKLNDFM